MAFASVYFVPIFVSPARRPVWTPFSVFYRVGPEPASVVLGADSAPIVADPFRLLHHVLPLGE